MVNWKFAFVSVRTPVFNNIGNFVKIESFKYKLSRYVVFPKHNT